MRELGEVAIVGCGYVGSEFARLCVARGVRTIGIRRRAELLPPGVVPWALDLGRAADPAVWGEAPVGLERVETVVAALSPGGRDEAAYRFAFETGPLAFLDGLMERGARPSRCVLVSSTGVYGQRDGEWVDETSPAQAGEATGRALLAAEGAWLARAPGAVVARLGGIYGPGRERLIDEVAAGSARFDPERPAWSNRIHRDDAARALLHLARLAAPEPIYNVVDRESARREDVLRFLAERLRAPEPRPVSAVETAQERGGGRGDKRVSSERLAAGGFAWRYPTFREGYGALIAARGGAPA